MSIRISTVLLILIACLLFFTTCGPQTPRTTPTPAASPTVTPSPAASTPPQAALPPPPPLKKEGKNPHFETQVLGSSTFVRGAAGSLRILAFDERGLKPVKGADVQVCVLDGNLKSKTVYKGRTNGKGTVEASFTIADAPEECKYIQVVTAYEDGKNTVTSPLKVTEPSARIYLTTDKPLYQPNQKIHIRALVFYSQQMKPAGDREIVLEVEDPKGNKVLKKKTKTSQYGIASTTFQLADDINLGGYKVKAASGEGAAEKDITVKKYVLPKFKSALTLDRPFYQPGMKLKGKLSSRYFYGKPVAGARVNLRFQNFDVALRTFAVIQGKTDKEGMFSFEQQLPSYFTGLPIEQGKAFVELEADVTDTADHKETSVQRSPVVKYPFQILVMPESRKLVPGLPNRIYFLTSYPSGAPAKCKMLVEFGKDKRTVFTDASGFGETTFTPMAAQSVTVRVSAADARGDHALTTLAMNAGTAQENIIVRIPQNTFSVGERLTADVLCTQKRGTAYLDIVRQDQTVLTKCVDLQGGKGRLSFNLTPETAGQVALHAYKYTSSGDLLRDTKSMFVNPARDLQIRASLNKKSYLPAENAKIDFAVKNKKGEATQAALGVEIVDESIFALAEKQPGLEKIYFMLQKELLTPKYEICNHTATSLILQGMEKPDRRQQNLTKILFTNAVREPVYSVNQSTYQEKVDRVVESLAQLYPYIAGYYGRHQKYPGDSKDLAEMHGLPVTQSKDPWGRPFKVIPAKGGKAPAPYYPYSYYYGGRQPDLSNLPNLVCLGADGKYGTPDDIDFLTCVRAGTLQRMMTEKRKGLAIQSAPMAGGAVRYKSAPGDVSRAAAPMSEAEDRAGVSEKKEAAGPAEGGGAGLAESGPPARIREFFPETLYVNPQLITDEKGNAHIELPMADSITTWRMSAFANTLAGDMGSVTSGIRVFQDFFVDIDLPVALTQNDEVSIPLRVCNYLPGEQTVKLRLVTDQDPWFKLLSPGEKTMKLRKDQVTVAYFRIKASRVGLHKLTFYAKGTKMSDAIRREIDVLPDGKEFITAEADRLSGDVTKEIEIPEGAVKDASRIQVTIYPGLFSQVVEGLDAMLRMPFG